MNDQFTKECYGENTAAVPTHKQKVREPFKLIGGCERVPVVAATHLIKAPRGGKEG